MLAEISDNLILGLVNAILAFLGTVFTGVMTYLYMRLNKQAQKLEAKTEMVVKTAAKVEQASSRAEETLNTIATKAEAIEKATNGLTTQLVEQAKVIAFNEGAEAERSKAVRK